MNTLQQVNPALAKTSSLGKAKRMPKHLIVLAKNQTGLRNLYKLISLAHLNYFKRFPIMPKSEINREPGGPHPGLGLRGRGALPGHRPGQGLGGAAADRLLV